MYCNDIRINQTVGIFFMYYMDDMGYALIPQGVDTFLL